MAWIRIVGLNGAWVCDKWGAAMLSGELKQEHREREGRQSGQSANDRVKENQRSEHWKGQGKK